MDAFWVSRPVSIWFDVSAMSGATATVMFVTFATDVVEFPVMPESSCVHVALGMNVSLTKLSVVLTTVVRLKLGASVVLATKVVRLRVAGPVLFMEAGASVLFKEVVKLKLLCDEAFCCGDIVVTSLTDGAEDELTLGAAGVPGPSDAFVCGVNELVV